MKAGGGEVPAKKLFICRATRKERVYKHNEPFPLFNRVLSSRKSVIDFLGSQETEEAATERLRRHIHEMERLRKNGAKKRKGKKA